MNFYSTRDNTKQEFPSAYVIKQGLAADGGLFIPTEIPQIDLDFIDEISKCTYAERAAKILSLYLTDYSYRELLTECSAAYSSDSFPGGAAPVVSVNDQTKILELWHGPTSAFKDMALQIMPRLLSRALTKTGETHNALILVATSGDTGKAALEGYKDVDRIRITVFYPVDGVSRVQKLQMATQTGSNIDVCAIKGNFDDAQTGVKKIFGDKDIADKLDKKGWILSSANSINWGRLAPQIVYYFSAYCDLVVSRQIKLGEKVNFCVPTGNFGNIFAAYLAKLMGLPIDKLICASNSNNILTDFLNTGAYDRNRKFHLTMSPSMDILISSNLERLLSFVAGTEATTEWMKELKDTGRYQIDDKTLTTIKETFAGFCADEKETAAAINGYYEKYNYLPDTHTAVALACEAKYRKATGDVTVCVVDSTASPYKFAADVYASLTGEKPDDPLEALDLLNEKTGTEIPYPLRGIKDRAVRFSDVITPDKMADRVVNSL